MEQLREPRRIVDDLAGVAGRVCIERAIALHDHVVPGACDERRLLLIVKIQVHAGGRFETDVIGKSRLAGEALEQCRHTAHAFVIEVRHGLGPKALYRRRLRAECETVADEEDCLGAFGGLQPGDSEQHCRDS